MPETDDQYLYLTTVGRVSGKPREIEIWFTEKGGKYYVISHLFERAQWVRNLQKNPAVTFRVAGRSFSSRARILERSSEPELCLEIEQRSQRKYDWSDGLIVELSPDAASD